MAGAFDFLAGVTVGIFGEPIELRPADGAPRASVGVITRDGIEVLGAFVRETRVSILDAEASDMDGGDVVLAGAVYSILSVERMQGGRALLRIEGPGR
jgi:hypothetical protein